MINKKKVFLSIIGVAIIVVVVKFFFSSNDVDIVRGEKYISISDSWNRMISKEVNKKNINVNVDGSNFQLSDRDIFMDDSRTLMVSSKILRNMMSCASNLYDNEKLIVEKGNKRLEFQLGEYSMSVNGTKEDISAKTTIIEDIFYVPFKYLCQNLSYDYKWDYSTNTISISNTKIDEKVYPFVYDYRTDGKVSTVKNQADYGTCWAFASLTALSSSILPEYKMDFSVDNMVYHNGYNVDMMNGGEYTMSMAYLTSWKGPVLEADDPYGDGVSPGNLDEVLHVQEIQIIESKNLDAIKKAVFLYGGVQSSLYMSLHDASGAGSSAYYDDEKFSYCYIGTEKANHDVVIVGWDDSYPAENFRTGHEGDGAFICVNSWGDSFGDNGYFYVSYYDSNIGIHNIVYTGVEPVGNYDNIYQSDELGWVGQLGYNKDYAFFANVYEARENEMLEAVGFYATGANTEYEIYCVMNFDNENSLKEKIFIERGSLANAGYYTIDLDTKVSMIKGQKYAVVVYIKTPNSVHPIAIEYDADYTTENVRIDDGEGYISPNGKYWEHVEETQKCNLCLKFYTNNVTEE